MESSIKITDENRHHYHQAKKVDFLTERWELEWYTIALIRAEEWGQQISRQGREIKRKNSLLVKYNNV